MLNNTSQRKSKENEILTDNLINKQFLEEKEPNIIIDNENSNINEKNKNHSKMKILMIITGILLIFAVSATGIFLYINNNPKKEIKVETKVNLEEELKELREFIKDYKKVKYEDQLTPRIEIIAGDGNSESLNSNSNINTNDVEYSYYFQLDKKKTFKILQLTDLHIRLYEDYLRNDKKALRAVGAMIAVEKPDLVIFTGDVCYVKGSLKNIEPLNLLIELMEKLGVYWTYTFGNHDTESGLYSRRDASELLEKNSYLRNSSKYCLFAPGPDEITGYGNSYINIKNKDNVILKSIILFDSNDYHIFTNKKYDRIHDDQIEWYTKTIQKLNKHNKKLHSDKIVPSETFFHIPINTYDVAVKKLLENKGKKTEEFERLFGDINEYPCVPQGFDEEEENKLINTILELQSTDVMHFGHDHTNNAKIMYKGKVLLSYSMSIDYVVYKNIEHHGRHRGSTSITYTLNQDATALDRKIENQWYYQDKYENVTEIPHPREVLQKEYYRKKVFESFPDYLMDPY